MIQTHRCEYCGDLATKKADVYLCDKMQCALDEVIRLTMKSL